MDGARSRGWLAGAQSGAAGQGQKRRRAGARQEERAVRVAGLGDVVVCSAGGVVLRLRHVVASSKHLRRESVVDAGALSRSDEVTDVGNKQQRRADESEGGSNRADDGGGEGEGRVAEIRRMGREALEAGLGRGGYVVGAMWDEGNMVQAMRRYFNSFTVRSLPDPKTDAVRPTTRPTQSRWSRSCRG